MSSIKWQRNFSFLLVLPLCWCMGGICTSFAQTDTMKPGDVLGYSEQLVSANGRFILGFFTPSNSDNGYLGIWFSNSPDAKVWVANRYSPVYGNSANLTMDADGILKIMHSEGSPIPLNSNQAVAPNSTATLQNSGNFVINELDTDGSAKQILWESFDHPTDTLLPGMKLGVNFKTGQNWSLASWFSDQIAASGAFTLEWNYVKTGKGQLVMRRRGDVYWTSGSLTDSPYYFTGDVYYSFNQVSDQSESYFNYSVTDGSISGWRLSYDGRLYDINKEEFVSNDDPCDGFASNSGCAVGNPPKCRSSNERLAPQKGRLYGESYRVNESLSLGISDCWAQCWNDCSCDACWTIHTNGTGCRFYGNGLSWEFSPNYNGTLFYILNSRSETNSGKKWWIWIIIAVVAVLVTSLLGLAWYLRRKKIQGDKERSEEDILRELTTSKRFQDSKEIGNDGKKGHDLKVFSFDSIMVATNNFSSENKLGQGGFGPVYKGKLPEGQEIAVKRLSQSSGQGLVEFKNELILIAKLQHMNLVRLLGCCVKGEEKMLIYEYMPNKSLDFFIFDPTRRELLDWKRRYKIIEGTAQGLLYLHKYSRLRIIHRDLKASNILLDDDMNPKISDFGMARIFGRNESEANTNRVVGTYGYMSPEYAMEGNFSEKSDVYSFGVLVLEIVSGRKNSGFYYRDCHINLVGYAWELWKEGKSSELIDSMLGDSNSKTQILRCIHVGLLCVQESAVDRPNMWDVISMLTNEAVPLPVPKQSAFSSQQKRIGTPSRHVEQESSSVSITMSEMEAR